MRVLVFTAMYPSPHKPAAGVFVQEQVESLRAAGVEVEVFAFEGNRSFRNYLKAGLALRQRVRQCRPDLVHAHYGLTGAAALFQRDCPVVITFHGSDLLGEVGVQKNYTRSGWVKTIISRAAAQGAAERIVVAERLKSKLGRLSSVTIPMGVNLDLFKPMPMHATRRSLGCAPERKLALFAAHPQNHVKRYDVAQAAVEQLRAGGLDMELLAVHGVPHERIPIYMNACDVLVLTSMHEASPCVIKEALACNLPIVSVDVGDVAERLEGVSGGWLCERTPQDVADKLRLALAFGGRSDGRQKISALSLPNVAGQVRAVYEQVVRAECSSPARQQVIS